MLRFVLIVVLMMTPGGQSPSVQPTQPPWKPENLQHFPRDISRDRLVQRMREFSFALGVRCQYCHTGGDGVSFEGVVFASDDKLAKVKARAMLRMVDQINRSLLPQVPARVQPDVSVDCVTCHRGLPIPRTLQNTLLDVVNQKGITAAVERYRQLRKNETLTGRYNFGEWEINELARRLFEAGNLDAAIAMLEVNGEFYPKSAAIDFQIAEIHFLRGEKDKALARYRTTLEKAPEHQLAKARIAEIEKK